MIATEDNNNPFYWSDRIWERIIREGVKSKLPNGLLINEKKTRDAIEYELNCFIKNFTNHLVIGLEKERDKINLMITQIQNNRIV